MAKAVLVLDLAILCAVARAPPAVKYPADYHKANRPPATGPRGFSPKATPATGTAKKPTTVPFHVFIGLFTFNIIVIILNKFNHK